MTSCHPAANNCSRRREKSHPTPSLGPPLATQLRLRTPFQGGALATPFLRVPLLFRGPLRSSVAFLGSRRSPCWAWPPLRGARDHLATVPTFLRFAFRFTLFALYSWSPSPCRWIFLGPIMPFARDGKRGEGERGPPEGQRGMGCGGKGKKERWKRKENERCLVHLLWGPDRYGGARG